MKNTCSPCWVEGGGVKQSDNGGRGPTLDTARINTGNTAPILDMSVGPNTSGLLGSKKQNIVL